MASQNYERLDIETFGAYLLESGELDPIYSGLHALFPQRTRALDRFLVSYWCFYHAGFACWMSEQDDHEFWKWMRVAAKNVIEAPDGGRWPRGSERRHFRGAQAINAVDELRANYHFASDMVNFVSDWNAGNEGRKRDNGISAVFGRVQQHRGFGDWISFKVADMMDRCLGIPVQFDNAHVFMFTDPVKGVHLAAEHWGWRSNGEDVDDLSRRVVELLQAEFGSFDAPPLFDRKVNIQEIETILCKWKSHLNGHYALGKDTNEIAHGLNPNWGETAMAFKKEMMCLKSYTGV